MARAAVEEVEDQAPRQRLRLIRQLGPKRLRSIALPICGESFKLFTALHLPTFDREKTFRCHRHFWSSFLYVDIRTRTCAVFR